MGVTEFPPDWLLSLAWAPFGVLIYYAGWRVVRYLVTRSSSGARKDEESHA